MPQRSWSRAWKKGGFIRRLSGLTCEPSTLDDGLEQWIVSCRAIPASPTASPGEASEPMMSAGSPTASSRSLTPAGLVVSSARTSLGMRTASSPPSSKHWSDWVAALRLDSSQRRSSVSPMGESGFSSWPTEPWMTPNVPNGGRSAAHAEQRGATFYHNDRKVQLGLEHQAKNWEPPHWRTPGVMMAMHGPMDPAVRLAKGQTVSLDDQVSVWPTPTAQQFSPVDAEAMLARRAALAAKNGNSGFGLTLSMAILLPEYQCSPPDPATPAGPTSSPERRTLNPLFVEWLMGWPIGWTGFGPVETASSHWWQAMRGELSRLVSRQPAQPSLL